MINENKPVIVMNVKELGKIQKGEIAIIGKTGKKKKMEIIRKAKEKGIQIQNADVEKMLKKDEKEKMKKQVSDKNHLEKKK